jgi:hypothetical protein
MMQLLLTSANLVSCRALHLALFHQRNVDPQENKTFSANFVHFFFSIRVKKQFAPMKMTAP